MSASLVWMTEKKQLMAILFVINDCRKPTTIVTAGYIYATNYNSHKIKIKSTSYSCSCYYPCWPTISLIFDDIFPNALGWSYFAINISASSISAKPSYINGQLVVDKCHVASSLEECCLELQPLERRKMYTFIRIQISFRLMLSTVTHK